MIELMQFECDRARRFFDLACQARPAEDRRSLAPAEVVAATYWRILQLIQDNRYDAFGKRPRLSSLCKFWIALTVYMGADWHQQG